MKATAVRKKREAKKKAVLGAALQSANSGPTPDGDGAPEEATAAATTRKPRKRAAKGQPAASAPANAAPSNPDAAAVDAQSPTKKKRKSRANAGAPAAAPSAPTVAAPENAAPPGPAKKARKSRATVSPAPGGSQSAGVDPGPSKEPPARKRASKPAAQKRIPANDPETSFKDIGDEIRKDPGEFGRPAPRDPNNLTNRQKQETAHGKERKTADEEGRPTPLSIPKYGVNMPWTGARRYRDKKGHERNKSSELGYERDADKFWNEYDKTFENHLSPAQKKRVAEGHAPEVDKHWTQTYPEHEAFIEIGRAHV